MELKSAGFRLKAQLLGKTRAKACFSPKLALKLVFSSFYASLGEKQALARVERENPCSVHYVLAARVFSQLCENSANFWWR